MKRALKIGVRKFLVKFKYLGNKLKKVQTLLNYVWDYISSQILEQLQIL